MPVVRQRGRETDRVELNRLLPAEPAAHTLLLDQAVQSQFTVKGVCIEQEFHSRASIRMHLDVTQPFVTSVTGESGFGRRHPSTEVAAEPTYG